MKEYIEKARVITFYGGAGVSTESGIPDYRSKWGRWTALLQDGYDPVKVVTPRYLMQNPEQYFKTRDAEHQTNYQPNACHKLLAEMEKAGMDVRVITQNVDSLHQMAGHRYVLELHGNSRKWHCMTCQREYTADELTRDEHHVPRCYIDNGVVRPDIVLFGESASKDTVEKAKWTIKQTDLLIIAGTSLSTPLARRLALSYRGEHLIVINHEALDLSNLKVDLFIQDSVGKVFSELKSLYTNERKQ